jgi:hypothetical protein
VARRRCTDAHGHAAYMCRVVPMSVRCAPGGSPSSRRMMPCGCTVLIVAKRLERPETRGHWMHRAILSGGAILITACTSTQPPSPTCVNRPTPRSLLRSTPCPHRTASGIVVDTNSPVRPITLRAGHPRQIVFIASNDSVWSTPKSSDGNLVEFVQTARCGNGGVAGELRGSSPGVATLSADETIGPSCASGWAKAWKVRVRVT